MSAIVEVAADTGISNPAASGEGSTENTRRRAPEKPAQHRFGAAEGRTQEFWTLAAGVVGILAVAAMAIASYRTVTGFVRSSQWVSHTHQVLELLATTDANLDEAISATRAYILQNRVVYVRERAEAYRQVVESLRVLKGLTADNAVQQRRVDKLQQLVLDRRRLLDEVFQTRDTSGSRMATQLLEDSRVSGISLSLNRSLSELQTEERNLLADRQLVDQREGRRVVETLIVILILTLAGYGIFFQLNRSHLARRRRAEAERDRFFNLSLDLLCIASTDGYFKRLNPAFSETLGYTLEEFLARPFLEFVHPDDRAATLAEVEKLAHGQPTIDFVNRYQCRDGTWKWLSWKVQPLPAEALLFATARDITEQREIEAKLVDNSNKLQAANAELESFSYSVSHDLRTPLRAIDGFAQLLHGVSENLLDDTGKRYITVIRDSAQRMGTLIDDLLTFSRLGRESLVKNLVDMTALAREAQALAVQASPGCRAIVDLEGLPLSYADRKLMLQVWVNLLSNAIKYSQKADVPRIEIRGRRDGANLIYFVRDNGVGFDMRHYRKLFGVFERLHSAEEFPGTGVGLAIVRRIVSRHDGRVWAESAPGAGATFFFSLPTEAADA